MFIVFHNSPKLIKCVLFYNFTDQMNGRTWPDSMNYPVLVMHTYTSTNL